MVAKSKAAASAVNAEEQAEQQGGWGCKPIWLARFPAVTAVIGLVHDLAEHKPEAQARDRAFLRLRLRLVSWSMTESPYSIS
jgi:hypothetical protein